MIRNERDSEYAAMTEAMQQAAAQDAMTTLRAMPARLARVELAPAAVDVVLGALGDVVPLIARTAAQHANMAQRGNAKTLLKRIGNAAIEVDLARTAAGSVTLSSRAAAAIAALLGELGATMEIRHAATKALGERVHIASVCTIIASARACLPPPPHPSAPPSPGPDR